MKIALVANTAWYLYNFRRNLMSALRQDGHEVVAIASEDGYGEKLRSEGFCYRDVVFTRSGLAPLSEFYTIHALGRALREERMDVALTYTPKGTIYTALALVGTAAPTIVNISGLGRAFAHDSGLKGVVKQLYRLALSRAHCVFFQNEDDRHGFIADGLVRAARTRILPGSGVDLTHFQPRPARVADGSIRVLMVSRLLWPKGVHEYIEAARRLRAADNRWHFSLLGPLDDSPESGVPTATLEQWVSEGWVEYLGTTDDVRPHLEAADCVVLPSYYPEGVPRSLLEAAAMARPVITTDAPGCRDCVDPGVTGYLCRARDVDDLVRALSAFQTLDEGARRQMGLEGRRKMERGFDERVVIERYRDALRELLRRIAK